ncbi:MAG: ribonuclease R [Phycisphaerales bacterium]|nr:ribonuclease R [Phycisphaerales bacterium]
MAKHFSERIIEFLGDPDYRPMQKKKLAHAMGVAAAHRGDFHDAVDALRRSGRVVIGSNNAVMLPQRSGQIVGTFRGNPRGFGFVVPDEVTAHGDLYIPEGETLDAVTGDRVACQVFSRGKRDGKRAFGGRIVEVVERGNSQFVGQLKQNENVWYVEPDGKTLHGPVLIGDPGAKNARAGDQVVIELTQYPRDGKPARGVIVERLGHQSDPGVDLVSICRQFHLPDTFPDSVIEETRALARSFNPDALEADREVVDAFVITIDPDDARDYDDAISLRRLAGEEAGARKKRSKKTPKAPMGQPAWELGVHIADVSHFVRPGTALDDEARERGTSVYLPGKVIPMLPEALSNGLCSLQEAEPRLCKSAFIRYDAAGKVISARFANTIIRSNKRLTYGQATAILDGKKRGFSKDVVSLVLLMDELARVIRKRRLDQGMIVLDLPDVDLILDEDGKVIDAEPEDTSFSHTIIEMFMVEANEAAARLLHGLGVGYLRRIHPKPDEEALENMARFVQASGFTMPKKVEPKDMQKLLDDLRGDPESYAINIAVLRSMSLAEYSPKPVGHFALASDNYAHFTSPIRRYPDLMVHREIDNFLASPVAASGRKKKGRKTDGTAPSKALAEMGKRMSYLSRRAESAERELKQVKVLTLLAQQVGEEFEGVVTGVTNFGLFIQHPKYLTDGLLRIEDLGDDWWDVNTRTGRIRGERSGVTFTLGSKLNVRIDQVDISGRQLNLILVDTPSSARPKRGRKTDRPQPAPGRGKAPAARGAQGKKGKAPAKAGRPTRRRVTKKKGRGRRPRKR